MLKGIRPSEVNTLILKKARVYYFVYLGGRWQPPIYTGPVDVRSLLKGSKIMFNLQQLYRFPCSSDLQRDDLAKCWLGSCTEFGIELFPLPKF